MDGESEAQREQRLKALWNQLDTKRKGYLDLPALRSGLAQMNHREQYTYTIQTMHTHTRQRSKMQMASSAICSGSATSITTGR